MTDDSGELTWRDHAVVFVLGIGLAVIAWLSGNSSEVPPDLWGEISVACGLRLPRSSRACGVSLPPSFLTTSGSRGDWAFFVPPDLWDLALSPSWFSASLMSCFLTISAYA